MKWEPGKPNKAGLVLIEWMNGSATPELYLIVKLKDKSLWLFNDRGCVFNLKNGAIRRHLYIPQPEGDRINGDWHTTDLNPETCEYAMRDTVWVAAWHDPDWKFNIDDALLELEGLLRAKIQSVAEDSQ